MASAPTTFDARSVYSVGDVRDQGTCNTCVSFTALGALQAAVSAALGRKFGANSSLSVQQLHFCSQQFIRGCDVGVSMATVLQEAKALHEKDGLVVEGCLPYSPEQLQSSAQCSPSCKQSLPELRLGTLAVVSLGSIWQMQQHIREHGSIMCRMELYQTADGQQELRQLYAKGAKGIYNGTGECTAGVRVWAWVVGGSLCFHAVAA
jgi:hypothetical protein